LCLVRIGRPGSGKTHLETAVGMSGIMHHGKGVRFYSTVDLADTLEQDMQGVVPGGSQQASCALTWSFWTSSGNCPFGRAGGAALFHLLSRLYDNASMAVTTDLNFAEWSSVLGDTKTTTA
jgi:DNA replication protein DnaC